jgi:ferredoxin
LRRLLVDKGYEPLGAAEITMPSNLRLRCPKAGSEQQVVERAMVDVDSFADDLANGRAVWPKARLLENVLHAVSRSRLLWAFSRWAMNLRHNADQCCTCGFCYEICPVDAINPNRTPVLDRKTCQLCMRCYSYCPVGAIRSRFPWKPYHAVKLDELVGSEEPEAKAGAQT